MPSQSERPLWLESLLSQFAAKWKTGQEPCLDEVLPADPERRQLALVPLVRIDLQQRLQRDPNIRVDEFLERYPELARDADGLVSLFQLVQNPINSQQPTAIWEDSAGQNNHPVQTDRKALEEPSAQKIPAQVGRYRIERILGRGGFGLVYLAHDDKLQRQVAIKVPHAERLTGPDDTEAYLAEARTVSRLEHPHIVPVYDVGSTADHPFFVVSKYIEGTTLVGLIKSDSPSLNQAVELVATLAETLHFAHKKGIVHRDIKPGNILLDRTGKPFVADFGLAIREQDFGSGIRFAGTPAYMSPEQARGEGHRVDGRSDLFSLGVVFYELLTGRCPFRGNTTEAILDQVIHGETRPPRQWDDAIPKELERICLKAMAKRASERYNTAKDFAEDLRAFLYSTEEDKKTLLRESRPAPVPASDAPSLSPPSSVTPVPVSHIQSDLRIVPKGLRSFDAHDADFFLELLPGPRDREGLPDSLRFWKIRIEEMDPDKTFAVGLIYGPSGCGKSSLVKAGLLPRLAQSILPLYLEATAEETEARLLKGLQKQCPDLPGNLGLIETLAALRRKRYLPTNKKILIVIDQFEQWLHARKQETNTELVQALRQCDGRYLQCIVLVRDDFWLAVNRFLRDLEIYLLEGQNSALVDLFDTNHARKVLIAFGRAFHTLPENSKEMNRDQIDFINQAIAGLAQEGKVISVRLALFAEMMKSKPWNHASLKAVGGTAGVGITFLEETFSAKTAPPERRYHQQAAQSILQTLLPESGTDIKGHMRSRDELLTASGYQNRPRDFADLLRILDSEIRLITPTEDTDPASGGRQPPDSKSLENQRYYQLTHDYLVPSLRDWLTRKQKETPQGRAQLLLADRAAIWSARPEARQLPSLLQWLQIRRLTEKKTWTVSQKKMMAEAKRYHLHRLLLATASLVLFGWIGYEIFGRFQGNKLLEKILIAKTEEVPGIVQQMGFYRRWANRGLKKAFEQARAAIEDNKDQEKKEQQKLSLSLAG